MLDRMKAFPALALALALSACQHVTPPPAPEAEAAHEQERLLKAQFEPIDVLLARSLEVQRAQFMWGLQGYPSVEAVRDGAKSSVILRYWGHEYRAPLPPGVWESLAADAPRAFHPEATAASRKRDRRDGPCHSWHRLEAALDGRILRATASPCVNAPQAPALAYADRLARLAIDNVAICKADRGTADTAHALRACGARMGPPTADYRKLFD